MDQAGAYAKTRTFPLTSESNIPYYIQLIELLKNKINRGEWNPGDQILSEPSCARPMVSVALCVRQALREVELEGLVVRKKGKGTFVG